MSLSGRHTNQQANREGATLVRMELAGHYLEVSLLRYSHQELMSAGKPVLLFSHNAKSGTLRTTIPEGDWAAYGMADRAVPLLRFGCWENGPINGNRRRVNVSALVAIEA